MQKHKGKTADYIISDRDLKEKLGYVAAAIHPFSPSAGSPAWTREV